jgi:exodeoxyribonuclease V alpha subunit
MQIERSNDDHVYYPYELLRVRFKEILHVGREDIEKAFVSLVVDKRNVIKGLNRNLEEFRESNKGVYLVNLTYLKLVPTIGLRFW